MRTVVPFAIGMGAAGLASQLLPLTGFPKAISVGLIAATAFLLVSAIARSWQAPQRPQP